MGRGGCSFHLKFDEAGNWKVVKMHRLSKKGVEQLEKEHEYFGTV